MVELVVPKQSPYAAFPQVGVTARPDHDLYYCRGGHWDGQIRDQSGRADTELHALVLAGNEQAPLLLLGECRVLDAGQRGQGHRLRAGPSGRPRMPYRPRGQRGKHLADGGVDGLRPIAHLDQVDGERIPVNVLVTVVDPVMDRREGRQRRPGRTRWRTHRRPRIPATG